MRIMWLPVDSALGLTVGGPIAFAACACRFVAGAKLGRYAISEARQMRLKHGSSELGLCFRGGAECDSRLQHY